MKQCRHPAKNRAYGWLLIGFIHREIEMCKKCEHFRLVLDPLRGWLVLTDKLALEKTGKLCS
jgi:hypothetical protein